ncbi:MAG: alpha/beta hydrolase [Deltaproteobacteria bacterium]|jgi:pimeloyl-ACP methyl ester carboxylesterase|nr:alpha/beta hydrolase [Deltaproteobacteria bacterium]
MEKRHSGGIGFISGTWPLAAARSTLVFIHGSGGSAHFWQAQLEGLAEKVNTVAIELPGHGGSESTGRDTVEAYVSTVIEFLDSLDPPGPIPCGLSLGGAITQQILLDYPDRCGAGILIGTGAKLRVLPAIFESIENDYTAFVGMISKLAASVKTDRAVIRKFQDDLVRCRPAVVNGDFQACNQFNVMARLGEISQPVLVISAENDQLTPPKYADYLESAIPHAVRARIADAGHIAPLEKPQAVNQAIIDFLDNHGL